MTKRVEELLQGVDAHVDGDITLEVHGITNRSNCAGPGYGFFCISGLKFDGHNYAQDAVDRGANLIVAQRPLKLHNAENVCFVLVDNTRKAMAQMSANYYDQPSHDLALVGITGTNGKTSTTCIVSHILESQGISCGIVGTIGNRVGDVVNKQDNTTPESYTLQNLFAQMRDAGNKAAVMEVSSHALDQYRTWSLKFAVTAFTNLTQDHLDYHKTFESYFEAKAKLFSSNYPAKRVICVDDEWGQRLAERCERCGDSVFTTSMLPEANIYPIDVQLAESSTKAVLSVLGKEILVEYPLVGNFNVSNVMLAFGIALQLGISEEDIVEALKSVSVVPGRLEQISAPGCARVFVDYAHTPDALEKALSSIRALHPKRIICVFGCGGNRDVAKRPLMGAAALAADFAIVTSDNPRAEDPHAIIADILPGMDEARDSFEVITDRAQAIQRAIQIAEVEDAVLIAGKGHEDYQIIGEEKIHFDDRELVQEYLQEESERRQ